MANKTFYTKEKRDIIAFVREGEKADHIVWAAMGRAHFCVGKWVTDDLVVTWINRIESRFGKTLLKSELETNLRPGVTWVDLPRGQKQPSEQELRLLASLRGIS